MTPFLIPVEASGPWDGYVLGGDPERQLHDIITLAYEAALEAGLSPERVLFTIENWLQGEQLQQRNPAAFSGCAISSAV